MMFEWLAEKHADRSALEVARNIEAAVERVLDDGRSLPPDLGGRASTDDVARAVIDQLPSR